MPREEGLASVYCPAPRHRGRGEESLVRTHKRFPKHGMCPRSGRWTWTDTHQHAHPSGQEEEEEEVRSKGLRHRTGSWPGGHEGLRGRRSPRPASHDSALVQLLAQICLLPPPCTGPRAQGMQAARAGVQRGGGRAGRQAGRLHVALGQREVPPRGSVRAVCAGAAAVPERKSPLSASVGTRDSCLLRGPARLPSEARVRCRGSRDATPRLVPDQFGSCATPRVVLSALKPDWISELRSRGGSPDARDDAASRPPTRGSRPPDGVRSGEGYFRAGRISGSPAAARQDDTWGNPRWLASSSRRLAAGRGGRRGVAPQSSESSQ